MSKIIKSIIKYSKNNYMKIVYAFMFIIILNARYAFADIDTDDMQAIFNGFFSLVVSCYMIGLGIGLIISIFKKV